MRNFIDAIKAWFGFAPRAVVSTESTTWVNDNATLASLEVTAVKVDPTDSVEAARLDSDNALVAATAAVVEQRWDRRLPLRLRSVGRLNQKSRRRKPVVAKTGKRIHEPYPMKRRAAVAKKPVLKVLQAKPKVRPSAMIIPFPTARVRKARLKLAA